MAHRHRQSGRFIIDDNEPEITIPEEQAAARQGVCVTASSFVRKEIRPHILQAGAPDYEQLKQWMRRAGELQLLGVAPAAAPSQAASETTSKAAFQAAFEHQRGQDTVQGVMLAEKFAEADYFGLTVDVHVHLAMMAIVCFGSEEQKERYLKPLHSGELIAAYALTEQRSGSDARSIRTTARLSPDSGYYVLDGSKYYVTNAGIAGLFVVFGKVDGDAFTAFLVEGETEGVVIEREERKMGMEGASVCAVTFHNVKVPVSQILGQVGKGHHIAFNILNYGRFHQAASCLGKQKLAVGLAVQYALQRKQFGRSIAAFPSIGAKLAEMNIAAYVTESMVYRTAGAIDSELRQDDPATDSFMACWEEYALECSINKVFASEALCSITDEAVQIYGGRGCSRDYEIEHLYRSSRMSRISEGTNEINRILVAGMLMKKVLKGQLPLLRRVRQLQAELEQGQQAAEIDANEPLAVEMNRIKQAKKIFLATGGLAVQKFGLSLEQEQEVLMLLSDMLILIYAMESAALRTRKRLGVKTASHTGCSGIDAPAADMKTAAEQAQQQTAADTAMAAEKAQQMAAADMTRVCVWETMEAVAGKARQALAALTAGKELEGQLAILAQLIQAPQPDIIGLKRNIAAAVIRSGQYVT